MFYRQEEQLCYDDVLLVPGKSLDSRTLAETRSRIDGFDLSVPIMSANMKSVTGPKMAEAVYKAGAIGALHRAYSIEDRIEDLAKLSKKGIKVFGSVGVHDHPDELRALLETSYFWVLDVANAYSDAVAEKIKLIKKIRPSSFLVVGNVSTAEGTRFLDEAGADAIKVGQGCGATCTTRIVTGHGYPQFSAVYNCSKVTEKPIIADGGIKDIGDVVKAIGAGAKLVMSGYLFAGCEESAGLEYRDGTKEYFGMASAKGIVKKGRLEGVVGAVKKTGDVKEVVEKVKAGLESALSYSNSRTLDEFRRKAVFVKVTPHAVVENYPRV